MEYTFGFAHFLSQADMLSRAVLGILLTLSVISWYLILTSAVQGWIARRRGEAFMRRFWDTDSLQQASAALAQESMDNAFTRLARAALDAAESEHAGLHTLAAAGGIAEYLTRVLRNGIDQEAARTEHGLTVLASAGSAAPYIGLFGTVWGIYHALLNIGITGQGSLDQVAGPVGEALIMTALGLAVAIPAVFAYNTFTRRNRLWLARLDAFAHDLYVLITVGSKDDRQEDTVQPLRAVAPN